MFCRLWSLAREDSVQEWVADQDDYWDAAVASNCALRVAFIRALEDEAQSSLRLPHGQALLDVEAFYDGIEMTTLASCALRKGNPPAILFLENQMFLAPRLLSQLDAVSLPFQTSKSVNGARFAKCLAAFACKGLPIALPTMSEHIWIDDLSERIAGSRQRVRVELTKAVVSTAR
eukprot:7048164-Pyramimonas_sp.AAC.1